eukprot:GCRY01002694.1.p1 GENE.GCRY01002694.1~~GCRY01002694.1.p1  ORF type:complete len:434 (+),score=82.47 GCRY01002694.1:207-1508(+)
MSFDEETLRSFFDLDTYISVYSHESKLKRLLFIAENCPCLSLEALTLLLQEITQNTHNIELYKSIFSKLQSEPLKHNIPNLPSHLSFNQEWCLKEEKAASSTQERLERELSAYKTNYIKESVRMGYHDLGEHLMACGEYSNALKQFIRTRDYCLTSKHTVSMCVSVVLAAIACEQYICAENYAMRALSLSKEPAFTKEVDSLMHCVLAVCQLNRGLYAECFEHLTHLSAENIGEKNFLAPQDVAVYSVACALISLPQSELKTMLTKNPEFAGFLDLCPSARLVLQSFVRLDFRSCFLHMKKLKVLMFLDPFIGPHAAHLLAAIEDHAYVQFCSAFSTLSLDRMAHVMHTTPEACQQNILRLIGQKRISARVDSYDKTLHAVSDCTNGSTVEAVQTAGEDHLQLAAGVLLFLNLRHHQISASPGLGMAPDIDQF